jgi:hypothetical protein
MSNNIKIEFTKKSFAVLVLENVFVDFNKPTAGDVLYEDVSIDRSLNVELTLNEQNTLKLIQNLNNIITYVSLGYQNYFTKKMTELKNKLITLSEVA